MLESERPNPFGDGAVATAYDSWFDMPLGRLVDALEWALIERLCRPQAGEVALDVGTGTGHFALRLVRRGLRVVGYDRSAEMLEVARKKSEAQSLAEGIVWRQGQAEQLPFADGSFHLVLCVTALEFVGDRGRALDEMWRVTAPGGRMVVAVLNAEGPWGRFYRRQAQLDKTPFRYAHFFTAGELIGALKRYGAPRWNSAVFFGPHGPAWRLAWLLEWLGQHLARARGTLLVGRVDK